MYTMNKLIGLSFLLFVNLSLISDAISIISLKQLGINNVDPEQVSVSGFSSGGAMSMQFHFVYSSYLKGAGIFAGSPYLCGGNFIICLVTPGLIDVDLLVSRANELSDSGLIDNVTNIENKKVFIYHGQRDTSNGPANGRKILAMYENYNAIIYSNLEIDAEHGMPTNNYGAACGESAKETEYITNCNFNGAFEMLNYIYDDSLTPPPTDVELQGETLIFDQNEFFIDNSANSYSMNDTGYIYIPSGCLNSTTTVCKLHAVFHGCSQYSGIIDDIYVTKSGYLEVAEINNIIVIFPQTVPSSELTNPGGCFDTWGYAEGDESGNFGYGTKSGHQVSAIFAMLQSMLQ